MRKLLPLFCFGIAFGFVEAAVVVYLRQLFHFDAGYIRGLYHTILNLGAISFITTSQPVFEIPLVLKTEMLREFATIIMLLSVAYLAGKSFVQRFGAFLVLFALWDIFYYVFLYLLIGWPKSLFDIDVYFLIPVTWIGPVITPIVASLIILGIGGYLYRKEFMK